MKPNLSIASWIRLLAVAFLMARIVFPANIQGQFHGFTVVAPNNPEIAHIGDSILAIGIIGNADQNGQVGDAIIVTNAYNVIYNFDNAIAGCPLRMTNFVNLAPLSSNNIVTNACLGTNVTIFGIKLNHQGETIFASNTWTVACDAAGYGFTIPNLFVAEAVDTRDQDFFPCQLSSVNSSANEIRVVIPCISCTMDCTNGLGENGTITYGGTVTNCGNEVLINIFVESNLPTNHTPLLGPIFLQAGQSTNFSGNYASSSAPTTNIITVRGSEAPLGQPVILSLTNTCSAVCSNIPPPSISVFRSNDGSNCVLSLATVTNRAYTVQFTDSLFPSNWQILTNLPGNDGVVEVRDSITNGRRFYRTLVQ